jgi:hypothetical protein
MGGIEDHDGSTPNGEGHGLSREFRKLMHRAGIFAEGEGEKKNGWARSEVHGTEFSQPATHGDF